MDGEPKGAADAQPQSGLDEFMSLKERGRTGGRSLPAFKRSNSERIPKFGGGSLRACPKFAATVDVPKGADPEAFQNLDSGQARLQELGYVQELDRHFGLLGSISAGFSNMSYLMVITGSLPIGLQYGGPVCVIWGWVLISVLQFPIGLALAELASSFPLAGGPYFWCVELTGNEPRYIIIAWITGWLNVLGQFASTAGAGYLAAVHLGDMIQLASGHILTKQDVFLVYAIVLVLAGILSSMPTKFMRNYSIFGALWLIIGGVILFVVLPACAPKLQPASFVFTGFTAENKGLSNIPNNSFLFLLGMLSAEYGYIGMESPAQLAEETKRADRTVPWAIVLSLPLNCILGILYILVILFCLPEDYASTLAGDNPITVPGMFYYIFDKRFGAGAVGIALSVLPLFAIFNTTILSMVTASRMLWSFARDGGVPIYKVWAAVSPFTFTPVNAVWAMTALAFLLGIPMLWSPTAFTAMGSITCLSLYASYAAPIVMRIIFRGNFKPGPFNLASFSTPILVIAVLAITFNSALSVLPTQFPINAGTLNWAPVTAALVLMVALGAFYFPGCGAGSWYRGKAHTLRDINVAVRGSRRTYAEERGRAKLREEQEQRSVLPAQAGGPAHSSIGPARHAASKILNRGGERYVESSSSSMVSRQDRAGNMRIPLLDLLKSQLPRDPEGLQMAVKDPARRCSSAECVFSRQATLFTVDYGSSKGEVVELQKDMPVAQQLRKSMDISRMEPPQIRRAQKLKDMLRRLSNDEGSRPAGLDSIREAPETPVSMAREASLAKQTSMTREASLTKQASMSREASMSRQTSMAREALLAREASVGQESSLAASSQEGRLSASSRNSSLQQHMPQHPSKKHAQLDEGASG